MAAPWCQVCKDQRRPGIDEALLTGAKPTTTLEKEFGYTRKTLTKHRNKCLLGKAGAGTTQVHATALRIHDRVSDVLETQRVTSELDGVYSILKGDWEKARERKEWTLAIKTVRELIRLYELQARLTLEAAAGRREDVSTHPLFLEFMSALVTELASEPTALAKVHALVLKRLGKGTAITVPG